MLKDFVQAQGTALKSSEIDFVEDMWTEKLMVSLSQSSDEDLSLRDEFKILSPFLQNLQKTANILDGGCGRGEWVRILNKLGFPVIGIDISQKLITALNSAFPGHKFSRGDIRGTTFCDEFFDIYFSWGAFEHFEIGLSPCLKEAYRILKHGGFLFFSVPYASGRLRGKHESALVNNYFVNKTGVATNKNLQFYQWRLTIGEVAREITSAGFTPLKIVPIHKEEGLRRMLRHDMGLNVSVGSLVELLLLKILRKIIPANYVSHMLLSVARK